MLQTRVTRTLINTSSEAYLVLLIRFIGATASDLIAVFESALVPQFTEILQKDIDRAFVVLTSGHC